MNIAIVFTMGLEQCNTILACLVPHMQMLHSNFVLTFQEEILNKKILTFLQFTKYTKISSLQNFGAYGTCTILSLSQIFVLNRIRCNNYELIKSLYIILT